MAEILQVIVIPKNEVFAQFKNGDEAWEESVMFMALVREYVRDECFQYLTPMIIDDFDYTLAQEVDSYAGIIRKSDHE